MSKSIDIRALMLAERFPPEFTGSGGQAVELAKVLIDKGVSVVLLCSWPRGVGQDAVDSLPEVVRLVGPDRGGLRSLQFAIHAPLWLFHHRKEWDILHVHGYCWAALSTVLLAKVLGRSSIYKIAIPEDDDPEAIRQSKMGNIKALIMRQYDLCIAISNRVVNRLTAGNGHKYRYRLIPNGVSSHFTPATRMNKIESVPRCTKTRELNGSLIVLYVGSIQRLKGIDILARAWLQVSTNFTAAKLLLVGPYDNSSEFMHEFDTILGAHLEKTVTLVGKVADALPWYQCADVFVFPSRNESFGNVLVEAMGCGLPCVATKIKGVTEGIINSGVDGIIVPQEDVSALADAIETLLGNQELRLKYGSAAAKTVKAKFCMAAIANRYVELYSELTMNSLGNK